MDVEMKEDTIYTKGRTAREYRNVVTVKIHKLTYGESKRTRRRKKKYINKMVVGEDKGNWNYR